MRLKKRRVRGWEVKPSTLYWLSVAVIDITAWVLVFFWLFKGVEGAGNIFKFLVLTALALVILKMVTMRLPDPWRPRGFNTYKSIETLAILAVLVWFGQTLIALMLIARAFLNETLRQMAMISSRPVSENLVTMIGDLPLEDLEVVSDSFAKVGKKVKLFNLAFCSYYLLDSLIKDGAYDTVFIHGSFVGDLKKLEDVANKNPGVKIYATISNEKTQRLTEPGRQTSLEDF